MYVVEGKNPLQWLAWLETVGRNLVTDEQDVRVKTRHGAQSFGSVLKVWPDYVGLVIFTYGQMACPQKIEVTDILRIEVLDSHRLHPGRAYTQMREMEKIITPPISIDDSCP